MQLAAFVEQRHGADSQDDEVPARISVIDVTVAVSGGSQHDAAWTLRRLSDQYPEVGTNCSL